MKSAKLNIRPEFNRSAVEIALVVSQSPELAAAGLQGALVRGKNVPALVADPCSKAEKKMASLAPMRYVLLAAALRLDISKHPSRAGS
jgi:hypothetical protein